MGPAEACEVQHKAVPKVGAVGLLLLSGQELKMRASGQSGVLILFVLQAAADSVEGKQ